MVASYFEFENNIGKRYLFFTIDKKEQNIL